MEHLLKYSVNSYFPPHSPVIKSVSFKAINEPFHIHPKPFITFYKQTASKLTKMQRTPLGFCIAFYFMECTLSVVPFCLAVLFYSASIFSLCWSPHAHSFLPYFTSRILGTFYNFKYRYSRKSLSVLLF
jgi:hypothetical protein